MFPGAGASLNWLRCAELEQVVDPLLVGNGRGGVVEGGQFWDARLDDLLGLVGQGLQDPAEILDGKTVRGHLLVALGLGYGGGVGWGDNRIPSLLPCLGVFLREQQRRQVPAHEPLQVVGQHAKEGMGPNPVRQDVVDGPDLQVDSFQ